MKLAGTTAFVGIAIALAGCNARGPIGGTGPGPGPGPGPETEPPLVTCAAYAMAPRRLLRVTLAQSANAVRGLLGDGAASGIIADLGLVSADRTFPPLNGPREGVNVIPSMLTKIETIASDSGQYVHDNFAAVTGCPSSADCVRQFLAGFAARAYRRPLQQLERDSLDQQISDALAVGASPEEAAQYGVYAVLMAPGFVYRTELGDPEGTPVAGEVALAPYELASQLSFFLTDGPPDAALLEAARQGALATEAGVTAEVTRLLATPEVRLNLREAISDYFKLNLLDNIVIDTAKVPAFNAALEGAMATESQMFLDEALWQGELGDLLISRTSFVNADLATTIYGIPAPVGATGTGFVRVELPAAERAGLLTRAAFITSRARPDIGSLVARGLVIAETIACDVPPGPPAELVDEEVKVIADYANATPRARAEVRLTRPECSSCHMLMDPYGLALDRYDVIARTRTQYDDGTPIDTSTTLSPEFDSQPVRDAVDLSQKFAQSHRFATCMARAMLQYALADVTSSPVPFDSCPVSAVASRFQASPDRSFSSLVREVVLSPSSSRRQWTE